MVHGKNQQVLRWFVSKSLVVAVLVLVVRGGYEKVVLPVVAVLWQEALLLLHL
jgi:hypothetical protein